MIRTLCFHYRGSIPGWEAKILHATQCGQKGERMRQLSLLPEWSGLFFFFAIFLLHCCCCLVNKSGTTLCNPMYYSPPGSSVHGISQARILQLVAISFSRRSSQFRDWIRVSYLGRRILYCWVTWEAFFYINTS